jgi:hypothetical protein
MAKLTIDIPESQVPRVKSALNMDENTNAEVSAALKAEIIEFIKGRVRVFERQRAEEKARMEAENIVDIEI